MTEVGQGFACRVWLGRRIACPTCARWFLAHDWKSQTSVPHCFTDNRPLD